MRVSVVLCMIALAAAAERGASQCSDPKTPGAGFALVAPREADITFSDGYRSRTVSVWPQQRPGACGWPMLVLVPGLGTSRTVWLAEVQLFAARGYFVISYDVRGQADARTMNPGRGSSLWGLDEWIDLAEVIEWTASMHRGTADGGRVAVFGDSQGGLHAWAAAAYSEKRLPPNGRRTRAFPKITCAVPRAFPPQIVDVLVPEGRAYFSRMPEFAFSKFVASVELDKRFRDRLAYYMGRDDPEGLARYLRGIPGKDFVNELKTTNVPILHTAAWNDMFTDASLSLAAMRLLPPATPKKLYLTTGYHLTPINNYQFLLRQELASDWFSRFLKGSPQPVEQGPPVLTAAIPANALLTGHGSSLWRHRADTSFPPADTRALRLHLRSASRLTEQQPTGPEGPGVIENDVVGGYDIRSFQRDNGIVAEVVKNVPLSRLGFTTSFFANDVEIAGRPAVTLALRPVHPEYQVGARLCVVRPDGRRQLIASGSIAVRDADVNRSLPVRIQMAPTSCVVPAGHRLDLELSNQAVHTPSAEDYYRIVPEFHDFAVTIGYRPGRLSWIDVPIRDRVRPDLSIGLHEIQLARPGTQRMLFRSSADRAGLPYVLFASLTGQQPVPVPGGNLLWLTLDPVTDIFFGLTNTSFLPGFAGVLDGSGDAQPALALDPLAPLPSAWSGLNLHLAPVVISPSVVESGAPLQFRLR